MPYSSTSRLKTAWTAESNTPASCADGKDIVLFFSSAWSRLGHSATQPKTNMDLAYQALSQQSPTRPQFLALIDCSGRPANALWSTVNRLSGHGLADDMNTALLTAHKLLAQVFQPNDRLYLFGASRGSTVARSLVGLLRQCGVLDARRNPFALDVLAQEALALYRNPKVHPNAARSIDFRLRYAHPFQTNLTELQRRRDHWGSPEFEIQYLPYLDIRYLGVMDTLGPRGIPRAFPRVGNDKSRVDFHDHELTSFVSSARHALAADEIRGHMPPALWDNLSTLVDLTDNEDAFSQAWFPGNHDVVCGITDLETPRSGISDLSLFWLLEGAAQARGYRGEDTSGLEIPSALFDALGTSQNVKLLDSLTTTKGHRGNNTLLDHERDVLSNTHGGPYLRHGFVRAVGTSGKNKHDWVHSGATQHFSLSDRITLTENNQASLGEIPVYKNIAYTTNDRQLPDSHRALSDDKQA